MEQGSGAAVGPRLPLPSVDCTALPQIVARFRQAVGGPVEVRELVALADHATLYTYDARRPDELTTYKYQNGTVTVGSQKHAIPAELTYTVPFDGLDSKALAHACADAHHHAPVPAAAIEIVDSQIKAGPVLHWMVWYLLPNGERDGRSEYDAQGNFVKPWPASPP